MRWIKVVAVIVAALIAFVVLESVWHLLQIAAIVLAIGVVAAVAVRARQRYRLARERRTRLRAQRENATVDNRVAQVAAAPIPPVDIARDATVDAELARLKSELARHPSQPPAGA